MIIPLWSITKKSIKGNMSIAAIGSTCFGIVFGWLVRYFLFRFDKFNVQILGSTVSVITGGGVIGYFTKFSPDKTVVWFYPIGLLIGFVIYTIGAIKFGASSKGSVYYVSEQKISEINKNPETD